MSGRFFLDTNIFVYSFDESEPAKLKRSMRLIQQAVASRNGVISYQVAQEFFNVALRRFARPLTEADAEQYLSTVFRPLMAVQSSPALLAEALRIKGRYRLSWYDSLIVAAAIEGQCEVLYSEDLQHGQRFGHLKIENPFL
ncbi:MAG TPA: PIN domain-containing protein [Candidatus Saccharimonadales bacterium]|jgi:predicted nucleic acid-binding protein|nr:PIN domain-containing protein [Candidatus Saccharimonadales bacterium]